jgi:hypothetical protein
VHCSQLLHFLGPLTLIVPAAPCELLLLLVLVLVLVLSC